MKKIILGISMLTLFACILKANTSSNNQIFENQSSNQLVDDEIIYIQPNESYRFNNQIIDGGNDGLTVKLCPGSGATCKIVISTSSGTYTYNGSKTKGGPDVVFK